MIFICKEEESIRLRMRVGGHDNKLMTPYKFTYNRIYVCVYEGRTRKRHSIWDHRHIYSIDNLFKDLMWIYGIDVIEWQYKNIFVQNKIKNIVTTTTRKEQNIIKKCYTKITRMLTHFISAFRNKWLPSYYYYFLYFFHITIDVRMPW